MALLIPILASILAILLLGYTNYLQCRIDHRRQIKSELEGAEPYLVRRQSCSSRFIFFQQETSEQSQLLESSIKLEIENKEVSTLVTEMLEMLNIQHSKPKTEEGLREEAENLEKKKKNKKKKKKKI